MGQASCQGGYCAYQLGHEDKGGDGDERRGMRDGLGEDQREWEILSTFESLPELDMRLSIAWDCVKVWQLKYGT